MNLTAWLREAWPNIEKRRRVVDAYRALGINRLLLADIAMRGGVYSVAAEPATVFAAGVNEGRRQMALEILKLCDADPALLLGVVERKPTGDRT